MTKTLPRVTYPLLTATGTCAEAGGLAGTGTGTRTGDKGEDIWVQLQGQAVSRLLQKSVPFICPVQLANEDQSGKHRARLCTSGFSSLLPGRPQPPPCPGSPPVPQRAPRDDGKGAGTSVTGWTDRREADEDEVR